MNGRYVGVLGKDMLRVKISTTGASYIMDRSCVEEGRLARGSSELMGVCVFGSLELNRDCCGSCGNGLVARVLWSNSSNACCGSECMVGLMVNHILLS